MQNPKLKKKKSCQHNFVRLCKCIMFAKVFTVQKHAHVPNLIYQLSYKSKEPLSITDGRFGQVIVLKGFNRAHWVHIHLRALFPGDPKLTNLIPLQVMKTLAYPPPRIWLATSRLTILVIGASSQHDIL